VLNSPERIRDFLRFDIGTRDHEVFVLIKVTPHHVLECVITHHAAAVILVHNHPSRNSQPSPADMLVTVRLQKALVLIDVHVIDHLIVGQAIVSMAELAT
jgi:DNA repair protein RadC